MEACEYHDTFLHLVPHVGVILNIDADHMEYFKTMKNLKMSFRKFALLTQHTVLINVDDDNTIAALSGVDRYVRTFGIERSADYQAVNVREYRPSFYAFDLNVHGRIVAKFELGVPGHHNVYNALAAVALASMSGCTYEECEAGIRAFRGAGRRFEFLGEVNGVTIADDYAHHPAELDATLSAAKKMDYKHVWAVFQPFTYTRTERLLDDFAAVLSKADHVVMTEIMAAASAPRTTPCARKTSPRRSPAACGSTRSMRS